jgi:hypothetical protein
LIPFPESVDLAEASSPRATAPTEQTRQMQKKTVPQLAARRSCRIGEPSLLVTPRPLRLEVSPAT